MSKVEISNSDYRKYVRIATIGDGDYVQIAKGKCAGLGRNGMIYPIDHVPVLPPATAGDDTTRGDYIGSYVLILNTRYLGRGIDKVGLSKATYVAQPGVEITIDKDSLMILPSVIGAGDELKVVTGAGSVDNGKFDIATSGDEYSVLVTSVNDITDDVTGLLTFGDIPKTNSGTSNVVLGSGLDVNGDGVLTREDIRTVALDITEDGHTNIQDVIKIVNDQAIN